MSMSAAFSALRAAGRQQLSASTIAARQATGSHMFRIDGYTQLRKMLANGEKMTSGQKRRQSWPPTRNGWGKLEFVKHEDLDAEKHLKDDRLTVLCDVTVTGLRTEDHVEAAAPQPTVVEPPFDMRGQLGKAIWNKKEVDVQIQVGGETLPAHRRILEAGSPVFKADLSLASATTGDTSSTALLRVDDMDAEVFKALLQFIYMDSPPMPLEKTMAERLLVAADRYELEKLKPVCEEALCRHVDMSSVAATLALAERHHCSVLRAACIQFLSSPGNLQAFMASDGLEQLRTGCPSALLDLVLKKITM